MPPVLTEELPGITARNLLQQAVVVIPTYNASAYWCDLKAALLREGIGPEQVLIVDSCSTDGTRALADEAGFRVMSVKLADFRHGATRQMAVEALPDAEFLIFITQDALPSGPAPFATLLHSFERISVGAAYGRQLPRRSADPIEQFARRFNYPAKSDIRNLDSRRELGFRTTFFSNSFAAYRRSALMEVGGFPEDAIVSEEVTAVGHMLLAGWEVAYNADATAIHSHALTLETEFRRYFDIGVHHGRERWLLEAFGGAGGEGGAFVRAQVRYLQSVRPALIPYAMLRNAAKWIAYRLGTQERWLPSSVKRHLSGQPRFWQSSPAAARTINTASVGAASHKQNATQSR